MRSVKSKFLLPEERSATQRSWSMSGSAETVMKKRKAARAREMEMERNGV